MIKLSLQNTVARVTLARAEAANALSGDMLRQFADIVRDIKQSEARVMCIAAEGKHFCAGADVNWMRESVRADSDAPLALAQLLYDIHCLPMPVLSLVHGACYGGGAGLAAVSDICIAGHNARFCFSEVKLGLIPATISPYVVAAIGERQARRYFLDGSVFSADTARQIGLAHQLADNDALPAAGEEEIKQLLIGGKTAQYLIKTLLKDIQQPLGPALAEMTAQRLIACRETEEAQEGIRAFLEKRPPKWRAP